MPIAANYNICHDSSALKPFALGLLYLWPVSLTRTRGKLVYFRIGLVLLISNSRFIAYSKRGLSNDKLFFNYQKTVLIVP